MRSSARRHVSVLLLFTTTVVPRSPCAGDELTLTEGPNSVVLHNALATARIDRATGAISDYHANDGVNLVRAVHIHPEWLTGACDQYKVVRQDASLVDLSFIFLRRLKGEETELPRGLRVELHYAMQPDTPGLYTYFVWKVLSGPAVREYPFLKRTNVSKFRIVTQETPYYYVDEDRNGVYPMHGMEKKRTVYDATWIFTDGTIRSKYDDMSLQYREHLLGKYKDTHGIFFIIPSNEWIGGGPFNKHKLGQK